MAASLERAPGSSLLIALVVDDDPDLRGGIAFKLERAGFEVRQAADGEAALAAAAEQRPDIVLLDWMMPRLSGVEICRALRADMRLRDTPVIMLSAKGLDADIESGLEAGADDFIAKPFSPGLVLDRVRAVLAQAALLTRSPATPAALAPAIGSQVSLSFGDTVAGGVVRTGLPAYEITLHQAAPVPLPARSQLHYMGPPGVMCQHGALRGGDRGRAPGRITP
ncbi:MAG TPA: response regulator [Solirubrobacteraceae bacterium]